MKTKKFKRVVNYFYPNGDKYEEGFFYFYFIQFLIILIKWIFYPLFFLFSQGDIHKGSRKVYWEEIK